MAKTLTILLHGILRSNLDMRRLENALKKSGRECLNIKYPSTKHKIETLTDMIYARINSSDAYKNAEKVEFVTHSMGGLIARSIIAKYRPAKLSRVVMLSPPHKGSELAAFLSENKILRPVFRFIFGPASEQLGSEFTLAEDEKIDYPLGIIACDLSLNPWGQRLFGGANDTMVSVASTKIKGMHDHIVLKTTHMTMMLDPKVIAQVLEFLEKGHFRHEKEECPLSQ